MSFIQINGIQTHYQLIGAGSSTVVFLHGLVIDNLSSWFFTLANPVSQSVRVLLYDLRGHGYSERPKEGYCVEDYVQDLRCLLDALDIDTPLVLVGNSFGGLLAIQFAKKFPKRILGLILVDSQINDADWQKKMVHSLGNEEKQDALVEESFPYWHGRNSRRKSNRLANHARSLLKKTNIVQELGASEIIQAEELKLIQAPTLAIYGAKSEEILVGRMFETVLQNCVLKIFDDCTHSVLWEKTEEVKTLIINQIHKWCFLDSGSARNVKQTHSNACVEKGL